MSPVAPAGWTSSRDGPWDILQGELPAGEPCQIKLLRGMEAPTTEGNLDVEVHLLARRQRYLATLFTLKEIERLMRKDRSEGDGTNGLYFVCPDLVIVPDLNPATIVQAVAQIFLRGELSTAFDGPHALDSSSG